MEGLWTVIGVILGWILSYVSQYGRLHIASEFSGEFTKQAYDTTTKSKMKEETDYFEYSIKLFIYNSSQKTKSIRDIKLLLYDRNKILEEFPFVEAENEVGVATPVRISARDTEIVELGYRWPLSYFNDENIVWTVNRIAISYKNEKNQKKIKKIKKVDYSNYFK